MKYRFILLVSAICEVVWVTALSQSEGGSRPVPIIVFVAFLVVSMAGLAYAMQQIASKKIAYMSWVGIGAILAAAYGIAVVGDTSSAVRAGGLTIIFGSVIAAKGVVGLKVHEGKPGGAYSPDNCRR